MRPSKVTIFSRKRRLPSLGQVSNFLESRLETERRSRHLQPALLQLRDCLSDHPVTEMALADAQQFRPAPLLLNFLDMVGSRDQIEFACYEQNPSWIA